MNSYSVVAGTGQRPQHMRPMEREWGRAELGRVMGRLRAEMGMEYVVSGMALGFDQWFAIEAVKLGCELHAYLPFPAEDQSRKWNDADRAGYQSLLGLSTLIRHEADAFEFAAYHRRNQAMVDSADLMVAMTNGKRSGGTWDCLGRIVRAGTPTILIHTGDGTVGFHRSGDSLAARLDLAIEEAAA